MFRDVDHHALATVVAGASTSRASLQLGPWELPLAEVHESDHDACLKAARRRSESASKCDPIR